LAGGVSSSKDGLNPEALRRIGKLDSIEEEEIRGYFSEERRTVRD
jgi:hypothetical protein